MTAIKWELYTADRNATTRSRLLSSAHNKSITFDVSDPMTCSFVIDGEDPEAMIIEELITDIMAFRNNSFMYRGRVVGSSDSIDADKHEVSFSATDYKGLLARRTIGAAIDTTIATDQGNLAWSFVANAQARTGGSLGITRGTYPLTGVLRSGETWAIGANVGSTITDIGDREYGYEWSVDPTRKFNLHFPSRGSVRGYVASYGGNVTSVRRSVDPSTFANSVMSSSEGSGSLQTYIEEASDITTRPEGRWDLTDAQSSTQDTTELQRRARGIFAESSAIVPSYELTMVQDEWSPNDCWLGDSIRVIINKGRLNVNTFYRVNRIQISIDEDGGEEVSLTVGMPTMSLINRLWLYGRRISELERR